MEDRFDRLEGKIDALITTVDQKFSGVDQKFASVEEKIGGLSGELRAAETRLRGHIEGVEAHLTGHIDRKVDALSLRVGVLHEDVKADFRFSLEARDGLKEQVDKRFLEQQEFFQKALAPLEAAVRLANEARAPETTG